MIKAVISPRRLSRSRGPLVAASDTLVWPGTHPRAMHLVTALGKVLLVSPLPRLECLLAAFHDGEHRVDDSGIVDTSRT